MSLRNKIESGMTTQMDAQQYDRERGFTLAVLRRGAFFLALFLIIGFIAGMVFGVVAIP